MTMNIKQLKYFKFNNNNNLINTWSNDTNIAEFVNYINGGSNND